MDCKTARLLLLFARPLASELEEADADALAAHVADCPECRHHAADEREADDVLGRAVRDVTPPPGLRERLLGQLTVERRTWYRRHVFVPIAAAATFLLAVGLSWVWLGGRRTTIDAEWLCAEAGSQVGASPDQVERWFAEQGVKTRVPREFNYGLLASYHLETFEKHDRIPCLVFARDRAMAKVYVLSSQQFDLKAAFEQRAASGGFAVEVRPHPERTDIAYLIISTGGPLEWFLTERPPAT